MTKQLILVRHGKSDHNQQDIKDFDRPLNHRGHKEAPEMAGRIFEQELVPQTLISSPALRALSTALHFAEVWNIPKEAIKTDMAIYEANTNALLHVVNHLDPAYSTVALFGHNPGITDFANYLCDADIYNIPTAGIVIIDFDVKDWTEISHHTGTLLSFDYPKNTEEFY